MVPKHDFRSLPVIKEARTTRGVRFPITVTLGLRATAIEL